MQAARLSDELTPIGEALGAAAAELAELAMLGDQLEEVVAGLAAVAAQAPAELLAQCQIADLLAQRLAGMAAYMTALAKAAPLETVVDVRRAIGVITLAGQARRLGGHGAGPELVGGHGDLSLFED